MHVFVQVKLKKKGQTSALRIKIFLANTVDNIYQLHYCELSIIANISVGMI